MSARLFTCNVITYKRKGNVRVLLVEIGNLHFKWNLVDITYQGLSPKLKSRRYCKKKQQALLFCKKGGP